MLTLGHEILLDLLALVLPARHVQTLKRSLNDFLHRCADLLLLGNRGVLDGCFACGIADVHSVGLVLISFHKVHNHVDNDLTFIANLPNLYVGINASVHRNVIIRDALDLGEQLLLAFCGHFEVFDCQVELLLIRLHGGLFENFAVVLHGVFQSH